MKTEWNLSLLYSSVDDKSIEIDLKKAEREYTKFEKKYKNKSDYLNSEQKLFTAIKDYETLLSLGIYKPYLYLHYILDTDSNNKKARAKKNLLSQRLDSISNKTIFFTINLSKIDKNRQKQFLKSPLLLTYKYFLKKIFAESRHILSESEEKILSLKRLTSRSMWIDTTEKMLNSLTVTHQGKEVALSAVGNLIHDLESKKDRLELHTKYMQKLSKISGFAEAELNAIVTDKKIEDDLRGFKEVYDSTILSYENDKKSIMSLVSTVTLNFKVSQDFFRVKAKMLGEKSLSYSDRAAKVGNDKRVIKFDESVKILEDVFDKAHPNFAKVLKNFLKNGQIDVFPKVGKTSGAYCSSYYGNPTFVLLNHTDSFRSLSTFAHEMGHAMHSEYSKDKSPLYVDYSMSTAEVASTLFESFLFYSEFEKMTDEEKVVALHDKISDDVQTIFRQIACFNFETEMHKTIREKGAMTKEELGSLMNKHMKSYLGPVFDLTDLDGNFFVTWSHLRRFFYVYSYGFGQLASKAIYKKYSEDKKFMDKIIKFLSIGGSMSPEDTFKYIGIDVRKPDFWKLGVKSIQEDIMKLEKLVNMNKL